MPDGLGAAGPLITDPLFLAAAVPAALLVGLSKSGFLSGFGVLAVPLLALVVGVPRAAAIVLPWLLLADVFGLRRLWHDRDAALLKLMLPPGLAGIATGALLFGAMPVALISMVLGVLCLLFVAQQWAFPPRRDGLRLPDSVGRVLCALSGFVSFVAHAGGPPVAAYLLPQRLDPLRLAGTSAVFFAALNFAKILPYAWLGLVDGRQLGVSAVLLPVPWLGVRLGVWALQRVDKTVFYRLAYAGTAAAGVHLVVQGLH